MVLQQRIEMIQNNMKQKEAHIKEAERQKKTLEVARQQQILGKSPHLK